MEGPDRAVLSSSLGRMTACRGGSSVGRVVAGGRAWGGCAGKEKNGPETLLGCRNSLSALGF